jgi:uncharacterized protein YecT (DUF1311 family)
MKRVLLFFSVLFLGIAPSRAQVPDGPVDCGTNKVVPFSDCVSPDGHYAVGWTLYPKDPSAKPVDWSLWKSDQVLDFLGRYDTFLDDDIPSYLVANYVIDLQTKHLLNLPCNNPYIPQENHAFLQVFWSELQGSTRYALVQNDERFYTDNLWLVTIDQTGMRQIDLAKRIETAVEPIVREKMPLDYDDYGTFFNLCTGGSKSPAVYQETQVVIPFLSSVPKSNSDKDVTGTIIVRLSDGAIIKAASDTKRDDPLNDVPELAKADQLLNHVFSTLSKKLDSVGQKELKQEQLGWIQQRNEDARQQALQVDDGDNVSEVEAARNKALLQSIQDRTKELQKRLGETK